MGFSSEMWVTKVGYFHCGRCSTSPGNNPLLPNIDVDKL